MPARVFVAMGLPQPTRDLMTRATERLLDADPSWRGEKPVAASLMHVTLVFIGAVPDASLPRLLDRLRTAVARAEPFLVRVSGARAVPSLERASMVWATFDGDVEAATSLATGVARAGDLPAEPRPFRLHATLLRARRPRRVERNAIEAASAVLSDTGKEADRTVSVRSVTVFSSTLGSAGPTYEPLAHLTFGNRDDDAAVR